MGAACSNESVDGAAAVPSNPATSAAAAPEPTNDETEPPPERRSGDEPSLVEGEEARAARPRGEAPRDTRAEATTDGPPPPSPFSPPPPPSRRSYAHGPSKMINPFPAMSSIPMALTVTYSFRSTARRSFRRRGRRGKDMEYRPTPAPPLPAKFRHFDVLSDDVVVSILSYVSYVPGEASTTESQTALDVCRLMNGYNREASDDARRRRTMRRSKAKTTRRLSDHLRSPSSRRRSSGGGGGGGASAGVGGASALALQIIEGGVVETGDGDGVEPDPPVPRVESPRSFGTLTHVLPLVSRRVRNLCESSDVPWKEALVRLASGTVEHEYDWEAGLRSYVDEELGPEGGEEGGGRDAAGAEEEEEDGGGLDGRERQCRRERARSFFDRGGGHRLYFQDRSSFGEQYRHRPSSLQDAFPFLSHRHFRSVELERRRAASAARLVARACRPPPSPPSPERPSPPSDGAMLLRRASDSFLERSSTTLSSSIPVPSAPSPPLGGGNARRVYASVRRSHMRFTAPVYSAAGVMGSASSSSLLRSDLHVGHGFALHIFAPPHRTMIRELMRDRPRKEREGVPLSACPKPKFVYVYDRPPLRGGSRAAIVEVRRCVVDRRGAVDVMLVPTAHVVVESVVERRDFGGLYDATVRKTSV